MVTSNAPSPPPLSVINSVGRWQGQTGTGAGAGGTLKVGRTLDTMTRAVCEQCALLEATAAFVLGVANYLAVFGHACTDILSPSLPARK